MRRPTFTSENSTSPNSSSTLAAACSAVEEGLKVTVIEKTETVNGRGGGVGACNSRLNKELGFEIEVDESIQAEEKPAKKKAEKADAPAEEAAAE